MKFFLDVRNQTLPDDIDNYPISGYISEHNMETDKILLKIKDNQILENDRVVGINFKVETPEDMKSIMKEDIINIKYIMITTGDWHVIPLENLIAKFNNSDVKLIVSTQTPEQIELLENILELGVDICLIQLKENYTLENYAEKIKKENKITKLEEAEIVHIERIGTGDRVCVDTVSILKDGEGLLVGSSARLMLLIQAEVSESGFVNARPFRVNAGVVASYTLSGKKTKYLSEIRAGSKVMIVNREGESRFEYVARIKIERRPLMLVRVKYDDTEYPIILQDAETVKVMTKEASTRVDNLKKGDLVLVSINNSGRHFGMAVDETVEER